MTKAFMRWLSTASPEEYERLRKAAAPTRNELREQHMEILAPQIARRFDTDADCLHEMPAFMCAHCAANAGMSTPFPDDAAERYSRHPRRPDNTGFVPILTQQFARSW